MRETQTKPFPPALIEHFSEGAVGDGYNSCPLTYQSPSARVSVALHERVSWNFGWQFYNYDERFTGDQNYHAHVSYSSLRWSF